MLARNIGSDNVAVIEANATIRDAAKMMTELHLGALVILKGDGSPNGIITDRDITNKVIGCGMDPDQVTVGEIMAHPVVCVRADASVETALKCMTFGVRRVPVVDANGQLVGIVTLDDLLARYASEFEQIRRVMMKEFALEKR